MSNNVSINTFAFSQSALDKRIANAQSVFLRSYASVDRLDGPASIVLQQLEVLFKEGRSLSKFFTAKTDHSLTVYLEKKNINELMMEVAKKAESEYLDELEGEKQRQQALLAEQLFEAELKKEQKKEEARLEKLREKSQREAGEYFTSLEVNE